MLAGPEDMPSKLAKALPESARQLFAEEYNKDFAWRASEAHALKAAWRAVKLGYEPSEDGTWNPK